MSIEIRTNRHGARYYIEPSKNGWFIGLVSKNVHGGEDLHSGHWYQTRHQALDAIADYQQ